jgi:phosphatidylglycerophosphate synthase
MLAGVALSVLVQSSLPIAAVAVVSVGAWLWSARAQFRATGFGAANWVTSFRLVALLALATALDQSLPLQAACMAFGIFCLDGLDGYLARRAQRASEHGAVYDSEVDACFTMLLTWGVFQLERAGAWVLLGGLLRYLYVLVVHHTQAPELKAPRTRLARYVFALSVTAYTASLWPLGPLLGAWSPTLPALATGLLAYSFGVSFYALFMHHTALTRQSKP